LVTKNTKIIIILSIFGGLIVFGTNFLPDLIQDESEKTETNGYSYETTFETGRPSYAPNKIISNATLTVEESQEKIQEQLDKLVKNNEN